MTGLADAPTNSATFRQAQLLTKSAHSVPSRTMTAFRSDAKPPLGPEWAQSGRSRHLRDGQTISPQGLEPQRLA